MFFNNRLYLAELYIDIGNREKAKKELEVITNTLPSIENTSSIAIANGLSNSLVGSAI